MFLFIISLLISPVNAEMLKIGIIDTGLDITDPRFTPHLCQYGHKDFTGEGINDRMGHGTHVVGSIIEYAKNANYCLIIYKYYKPESQTPTTVDNNLNRYLEALHQAIFNEVQIINYSGGGSLNLIEAKLINENKQITFIVAAGNEHFDLDKPVNNFYPAKLNYKNIIAVGSKRNGKISSFSNYGSCIKAWENGEDVLSTAIGYGKIRMSGTSFSTAIHTGKMIYELYKKSLSNSRY